VAWAILGLLSVSAKAAPSLEAYGRLPNVEQIQISPDGTKLALLVSDASTRQIQVREAGSLKIIFVTRVGKVKVRYLQWAGDNHVLIVHSVTDQPIGLEGPKREWSLALDLDLEKKKAFPLMEGAEKSLNTIEGSPTVIFEKGVPVVIVMGEYFPGNQGVFALYKINLKTHYTVKIEEGAVDTREFLVGPNGDALARADYVPGSGTWRLLVRPTGRAGWKVAYAEKALVDPPSIEALGHDGRTVLVDVHGEDGWVMHEANLQDGAWSGPVAALTGRGIITDPRTHTAIGGESTGEDRTKYEFLAPEDQKSWDAVARAFPKEELELASWSDDRRHIIVKAEGGRDGAAFFNVDLTKGAAAWLADEYADISADDVATQSVRHYKAADGLDIPAYLTLPKDRPGKGLPLIVLTHGGPAARDDPGFDWWAQALASRGYAVLQPQFRGSTGFGARHRDAGFGEWGRKMQTDLSDGVRDLAKSGVIDPKRVCIMGASYGGTAAANAAVFDPAPYRCAVDVEGVVDLKRFLDYEDDKGNGYDPETQRWWLRFIGAKSRHDPLLDELSPARHADKVAIPILLIHGQDDTVVPYDQSREMADALKRAGKPVEFVTMKGEDHWLSHGETRLQMLTAAVAFVEKHNPPDPAAPAPGKAAAAPTH
jgi:dipeptidyl aminopeptidase/acylaminoacyl peptidase